MKRVFLYSLSLLVSTFSLMGDDFDITSDLNPIQDEVKQVDLLIISSKDTVKYLEALKKKIVELKEIEKNCIAKPNDSKLLFKLASCGAETYTLINDKQLNDYFREEFMLELKKLHNIASKKTIPPAQ